MKRAIICCAAAFSLSGCISHAPLERDGLPPEVGGGIGSQYGNYEMHPVGETHDAAGNRCVTFNWDRPLNKYFAVRYATKSCESKEHPIWMNATPYERSIVPISQTDLKNTEGNTSPFRTPD